jgi:hypothetical protein
VYCTVRGLGLRFEFGLGFGLGLRRFKDGESGKKGALSDRD